MSKKITVTVVNYGRKHLMLRWTDPTTGKRKTESSECDGIRAAHIAAQKKEDELNAKQPKGTGSIALSDFVDVYTDDHLSSLAVSSMNRALSALNVLRTEMDPQTLADVTGSVLSTFAARLRKLGRSESTISTNLRSIRAALSWAKDAGHIAELPPIPKQTRAKSTRAKGRPISDAEFWKIVRAVRHHSDLKQLDRPGRRKWRRLLVGLWLSGLRLDESLRLEWNTGTFAVDVSGKFPLFRIAEQKSGQNQLLPLTPDFGRWLLKTPESSRTRFVFALGKLRHKTTRRMDRTSETISELGELAGVVVSDSGKFASAHDLRRTFGLRWSQKVMPAELQALMRHADIQTTMSYYVLVNAQSFAEKLWNIPQKSNSSGNSE
jgi:integrase